MAKYGIPYQGSKSGIADTIIAKLPGGERFVDLFGGGFAMSECALRSGKYKGVLYNELNPLLPPLIKRAIEGKYNYSRFKPEWISRAEFDKRKDADGYVKYIWSFSNSGKNYLFGAELEPLKKSLHNFVVFGIKDDFIKARFGDIANYVKGNDIRTRRILLGRYMKMKQQKRAYRELQQLQRLQQLQQLQQLEQLERLELVCGSYEDYEYQKGDVVYCDPPYEATAGYSGGFDHKRFYDWLASRPYEVFFSSYQISDKRFKMIFAKGKQGLMGGAANQKARYECLYTNGQS